MRRRAHRAIDSGGEWARVEVRVDHRLPSERLLDPPRNGGHVDERRALAQHLICEQRRCSDPLATPTDTRATLTPKEPPSRDISYLRLKLVDSLDVAIQPFFPIIFQSAHGDFRTVDLTARGAKHTLDVPPEDRRAPSTRIVLSVARVQADAQTVGAHDVGVCALPPLRQPVVALQRNWVDRRQVHPARDFSPIPTV